MVLKLVGRRWLLILLGWCFLYRVFCGCEGGWKFCRLFKKGGFVIKGESLKEGVIKGR